ncbi:threonine/serine exporter family protein [Lawsonibacter celer]|uniref:threonine/serine exporter family protein n=1 Tax=Lawsonibacter celer TaxID=2986526 RepID=UPI001A9ADE75|nr:threonine/serine exporter family protein [Lawsonibacter celer]
MPLDYDKLMALSAELGYRLMESGAEIYRVEESMQLLLHAYGVTFGEVFAIPNCIIVTLTAPDGRPVTQIRRVPAHGTNLDQVERLNDLCRRLCRGTPPLDEAAALLEETLRRPRSYSLPVQLFAYFLGCGSFVLFFGGSWRDGLCGGVCGTILGLCLTGMNRLRTNAFFKTIAGALISALIAVLLVGLRLGAHQDRIIIGTLMVLVPGIAFTNAMRDVMAGDMVAGISKITEALFIGAAIALGTALALGLARMLGGG